MSEYHLSLIEKLFLDNHHLLVEKQEFIKKIKYLEKRIELLATAKQHNVPKNVSQKMDEVVDELTAKDKRIKHLEEICLSKRKRVEYPGSNVVYMLTTEDHVKRRTYIIGKAKNLTARLGTYNKTCDHVVVHYRECKSEKEMDMVESLLLTKLDKYREQANRDRFILPEGEEVEYFIKTVDECVAFLCL